MTKARNYLILAVKTLVAWGIFIYYVAYVAHVDGFLPRSLGLGVFFANLQFVPFLLLAAAVRGYMGHPLRSVGKPMTVLFGTFFGGQAVLFVVHLVTLNPSIMFNPFVSVPFSYLQIIGNYVSTRVITRRSEMLLYVIPAMLLQHYSILAFDPGDERTFAQRFTALTGLKAPAKTGPVFESKERFQSLAVTVVVVLIVYGLFNNYPFGNIKSIYFRHYTRRWLEMRQPIDMPLSSTLQLDIRASDSSIAWLMGNNWWHVREYELDSPRLDVKYSSSDPRVADVTDRGLVTARSMGEAKIRAAFGRRTTECPVVVYSLDKYGRRMTHEKKAVPKPDLARLPSLEFRGMEYAGGLEIPLSVGDRRFLRVNGRFFDIAASEDVTYDLTGQQSGTVYVSSDPSVAAVSADGDLVAISAGKTEITAKNDLDKGVSCILSVTVHDGEDIYPKPDLSKISSIRLGQIIRSRYIYISDLSLSVGDKYTLPVIGSFYSEDPSRPREYYYYNLTGTQFGTIYSSDAPSVAAVSDDGRLEALSSGVAKIVAYNIFNEFERQYIAWYVDVMGR